MILTPRVAMAVAMAMVLLVAASGCRHAVLGKPVPWYGTSAQESSFAAKDPNVAVLHYYGVGGWGILWRGQYLLTAPYFSNHGYLASSILEANPDRKAIDAGFAHTPIAKTEVILVGHGHVDHASDIPAYPFADMIRRPTLIADESTINQLGKDARARICPVRLGATAGEVDIPIAGDCPTGVFRIRALPWAHAPHTTFIFDEVVLNVGDPQGTQTVELAEPPAHGVDWLVGRTWAFLIELLDDEGKPVFRIHYVDSAANPSFVERHPSSADPVDVHIACVAGFDRVDGYPEEIIKRHRVEYVLGGHWEDFFRRRSKPLAPVSVLDDEKIGAFMSRTQSAIGTPVDGSAPINKTKCRAGKDCGPAGKSWTVPIPGETFWFRTSPTPAAH